MGVQTRRTGFPVCGATSWSADGMAVHRGGRNEWWHPKAVYALDFVNLWAKRENVETPIASGMELARDSEAMLFDRAGVLRSFVADEMAIVATKGADFEGQLTNKIRNPRGEGGTVGVIGSGGVLPTNMSVANISGISTEYLGQATVDGVPGFKIRFYGVAGVTGVEIFSCELASNAAAVAGQAWGCSFFGQGVSGTQPPCQIQAYEFASSSYAKDVTGLSYSTNALPTTLTYRSNKGVVTGNTTTAVRASIVWSLISGVVYDFTVFIGAPKLVQIPTIEGPELVINGDFASAAGWTLDTSSTIGDGVLNVNSSGVTNPSLRAASQTMVTGVVYKTVFSITEVTSMGFGISATIGGTPGTPRTAIGTYTEYLVKAAGSNNVVIQVNTGSYLAKVDNFSVKQVTPGYMPAYPILPPAGTIADSMRSADVLQTAVFSWFDNAGLNAACSELVAASLSHVADGVQRTLFEYSDGTSSNVICALINASDCVELRIVTDGVPQAVVALASSVTSANCAFAFGWSATGGYITNGTEMQTFASVTLPSVTQKRIGSGVTSPALNDLLRQAQACTLLTSSEAANWAASN